MAKSRYSSRGRYGEYYGGWAAYVPVAQRRAQAEKRLKTMFKKGQNPQPVKIEGRKMARSFWGQAWCGHLEGFSDFANRLPRGRTYARNGSVCHLEINPGQIKAMVSGSQLYNVTIDISPLNPKLWKAIIDKCRGQIGSMLELLQGRFSQEVMAVVTDRDKGMLPQTGEIKLKCSCPDWATMCKHVAAVLYGVGNRLDTQPELLFTLRQVDANELISAPLAMPRQAAGKGRALAEDQVASVFGIEMDEEPAQPAQTTKAARPPAGAKAAKNKKTGKIVTPKAPKGRPVKSASPAETVDPKQKALEDFLAATDPENLQLTGDTIKDLRMLLNLDVSRLADELRVSPQSIVNWEKKTTPINFIGKSLRAWQKYLKQLKAGTVKA